MAGKIGKGIAGMVGLGQEAYHHNKKKKAAASAAQAQPSVEQGTHDDNVDDDEDNWLADDVQEQLHPDDTEEEEESTGKTVEWFKQRHPPSQQPVTQTGRLPAPVAIPQKRPEMRSRGAAFLDFLEGFHKEIKKHGIFNVTNIAVSLSQLSYTLSVAPSAIVHFVGMAVHISIEAGRRLYISKKQNSYIDDMNEYYFQPRGLYAMIMTYKPGSKNDSELLDFESATGTAIDARANEDKSKMQDYKPSSGKMYNQQIPEVCPLVFPDMDKASSEQQENALKRSMNFTRDYYDRRSQAGFAARNPESKLNAQEQHFAGSYGDPIRFDNSGILGVATAGRIDPRRRRWDRKNQLRQRLGKDPAPSGSGLLGREPLVKRALKDSILYLMIVNMPSEEELEAAKAAEAKFKKEQPSWFEKVVSR